VDGSGVRLRCHTRVYDEVDAVSPR
jgi:hypothetical protein